MRIVVTGGAGFIGSHLVAWLVEQGHTVCVLDNFSTGQRAWLQPVLPAIELIEGDITDFAAVQQAAHAAELIFHLAAMISVNESIEHPRKAYDNNVIGTLNVLEAARLQQVRRVVQMSSSAVYGDSEQFPSSEQDQPAPLSPYASSKLAAEQAGQLYTRLYGVEVVALRGFNIYGPRQSPTSPYAAVIPRFIAALRAGEPVTIYGDGEQSRDFIFVGDLVAALWAAAQQPGIAGSVFNAGCGQAWSIRQLALLLGELLGQQVQSFHAPPRSGEVRHSCADVTALQEQAGFVAHTSLREGLAHTLAAWDS